MAPIPIFIKLGTAILRVAAGQAKNLFKKGGKEIKNPSLKQKQESIPLSELGKKSTKSSRGANVKTKGKKPDSRFKKESPRKELNPKEDIKLESDLERDLPWNPKEEKMIRHHMKSGGMIKKNKKYAYGGRVAKYKG